MPISNKKRERFTRRLRVSAGSHQILRDLAITKGVSLTSFIDEFALRLRTSKSK
jgi:hypothetical protein